MNLKVMLPVFIQHSRTHMEREIPRILNFGKFKVAHDQPLAPERLTPVKKVQYKL